MNVIISNRNKDILSELNVDVLKSLSGEFTADEIIQSFSNFFFNRMFLDITAIKDYTDIKNIQKLSIGLDVSKIILLLDDSEVVNSPLYKSKLVSFGIYNFTNDLTGLKYLYDNPNEYKDVANYQDVGDQVTSNAMANASIVKVGVRIIGFKNVTNHAGATSLIYMMKKALSSRYSVFCIEVNKKDFMYFNDENMVSISVNELGNTVLKYKDADIILIDLNDMDESTLDGDVIYLVEPSTIKLNKVMLVNRNVFSDLVGKNVVLNMSLLSNSDIKDFESESGCKVLYSLQPMNDKVNNEEIMMPFFETLGLVKKVETESNNNNTSKFSNLFGFLKKN